MGPSLQSKSGGTLQVLTGPDFPAVQFPLFANLHSVPPSRKPLIGIMSLGRTCGTTQTRMSKAGPSGATFPPPAPRALWPKTLQISSSDATGGVSALYRKSRPWEIALFPQDRVQAFACLSIRRNNPKRITSSTICNSMRKSWWTTSSQQRYGCHHCSSFFGLGSVVFPVISDIHPLGINW